MLQTSKSTPDLSLLPPIEKAKKNILKVNEYDYQKMINEFKFQDSYEKIKREKIQKVKQANSSYEHNITQMKEKVKEAENSRMQRIKKNLSERNRILNLNRISKEREKEEKMSKARSERERMNSSARLNASQHIALMEEKRIMEEQRTEERMQGFMDKYLEISQERKNSFSSKQKRSFDQYLKHHLECQQKKEKELEDWENHKFNLYCERYWNNRERTMLKKETKMKYKEKLSKVQELKEEFSNQSNAKRKQLLKKINSITIKCQLAETKKQNKIDRYTNREIGRKCKVIENSEQIRRDDDEFRHGVLEYQREMVGRGMRKDTFAELKRYQAIGMTIQSQMELEQLLPRYEREINQYKGQSVTKLSHNQRRKIYRDLLRAEAERKRKEEEKKLDK